MPATHPPVQKIKQTKWFGWKHSLPDMRDHLFQPQVVESPVQDALPTDCIPMVRDQGEQGSCTGHAGRGLGQYTRNYERQRRHEISPRFVYWNARGYEGTHDQDAGAEIRDVLKGVGYFGFARETDCPYRVAVYSRKPTAKAFENALKDVAIEYLSVQQSLAACKQVINAKMGLIFGFSVYASFDHIEADGLMPMPGGELEGGHAVWACEYDDNKQIHDQRGGFLIQNSWGNDWGCPGPTGERGYFWMPYSYISNPRLASDFWTIRKIS